MSKTKKFFSGVVGGVASAVRGLPLVGGAAGSVLGGLGEPANKVNTHNPVEAPAAAPEATPMRELPPEEKDLTTQEIAQKAAEAKSAVGLMAPSYLGLASEMTPMQKRTAIATQATSGDVGQDPNAFKYYRNLAFQTLSEPGQAPQSIERSYLNLFGEPTRDNSTGGYLSAIERIYKRLSA